MGSGELTPVTKPARSLQSQRTWDIDTLTDWWFFATPLKNDEHPKTMVYDHL